MDENHNFLTDVLNNTVSFLENARCEFKLGYYANSECCEFAKDIMAIYNTEQNGDSDKARVAGFIILGVSAEGIVDGVSGPGTDDFEKAVDVMDGWLNSLVPHFVKVQFYDKQVGSKHCCVVEIVRSDIGPAVSKEGG